MNLMSKLISPIAVYFVLAAALLAGFFELWRLIALIILSGRTTAIPAATIAQSFLVGLRFDFAIACYIVLPFAIIGILPLIDIIQSRLSRIISTTILCLFAAFAFFIHLVDIEFFRFFNTRLNAMALEWSDSPNFIQAMVWESFHVVWYLLLFAAVITAFIICLRFLQRRTFLKSRPSSLLATIISLPLLAAILLLGIRGRIEEKAPLTWGQAYFSDYAFANLLALNPVFTFGRDLIYDSGSKHNVDRQMRALPVTNSFAKTANLLDLPSPFSDSLPPRFERSVHFDLSANDRPNVILILMESFASAGVGCLNSRVPHELTPQFDSLARHGVLFTNFYSAGMHTYAGILGSIYGYPSVPGKSPMKQVSSQDNMWGLPSILREYDYHTMFFTTHDPHFDNMQGFLKSNGIRDVYSLFDFDQSQKLSTLGVPDHVMFDAVLDRLRQNGSQPFFAAVLSGTNHGPWYVPDVPFGALPDSVSDKKRFDAFKYSDWALGRFLRQILSDSAFANTIVVVTGDHGLLIDPVYDLDLSLFQVPLLILDPRSRAGEPRRIERFGSQVDIVATVMGLLHLDYHDFTFGRNLLAEPANTSRGYAIFSEGYNVGIVESNFYAIIRPGHTNSLYDLTNPRIDIADLQPDLLIDLSDRSLAYFQAAYFNLQRPLNPSRILTQNPEN
ncbi:MAG: sulfatase-like hydrolase/transferase [Candidatus Zixiibacteriota bacterium]